MTIFEDECQCQNFEVSTESYYQKALESKTFVISTRASESNFEVSTGSYYQNASERKTFIMSTGVAESNTEHVSQTWTTLKAPNGQVIYKGNQ